MAQIARFLDHETATFGSLNRWEKLGFFLCLSCVSACIAQLSYHLRNIDPDGKISGARWLELSRPLADHQRRVLEAQHTDVGNAYFYGRPATFSLIAGYENHGLLLECEAWYKKLIAKEEEVRGKESFSVRELMLKLANFYENHNRRADADEVMERLHVMAMHPDKYGDRWTLEPVVGGTYRFVRVVSD